MRSRCARDALDELDRVRVDRRVAGGQPVGEGAAGRAGSAARTRTGCRARACGTWCVTAIRTLHATEVAAVAGVDLDLLAGDDEQRDLDLLARLQRAGLVPPLERSPCRPGLGVLDRGARPRRAARCRAGRPRSSRRSRPGCPAGSPLASPTTLGLTSIWSNVDVSMNTYEVAVVVQVLHVALVDVGGLDLEAGVERPVDGLARLRTFLSFVRTMAPPLPGLWCWNQTTDQSCPSRLSTMPFLRSFVVAISRSPGGLWSSSVSTSGAPVGHEDGVFDAHSPTTRHVDARLHREDGATGQFTGVRSAR